MVGCDGFWGVARNAIPAPESATYERTYPFGWLGILADVAPSHDELVYARSDRGFALLSMRSPSVTRAYLQVPEGTDAADWSDDAIWDELDRRLAVDDPAWRLARGPITQKSVTPMRSYVHEPMRHGRLFLAGDAAHIVPPTGAEGLNLAVGDVVTCPFAPSSRPRRRATPRSSTRISETCLRRVWQAERFSLRDDDDAAPRARRHRVRRQDPARPARPPDHVEGRGSRSRGGVHRFPAVIAAGRNITGLPRS